MEYLIPEEFPRLLRRLYDKYGYYITEIIFKEIKNWF